MTTPTTPMQAVREITRAVVFQPGVDTSDPASLRAMHSTMRTIARSVDAIFEGLAAEANITGADASFVGTGGYEANLESAMFAAIDRADEAARERDAFDQAREYGTLNLRQQGIAR